MNEPVTPSPEPDRSLGYEATDVNVWYVMAFGLGLALMVVAVLPLMGSMFGDFETRAKRRDVPRSPLAKPQEPPAPRLESEPSATLAMHRRQEDEMLAEYRWIDKQQGVAQIPVDHAMKLLLERGLPEPKAAKEESRASGKQGERKRESGDDRERPGKRVGRR